jgi:hypothetical protein
MELPGAEVPVSSEASPRNDADMAGVLPTRSSRSDAQCASANSAGATVAQCPLRHNGQEVLTRVNAPKPGANAS